jgi:hypothetical protein
MRLRFTIRELLCVVLVVALAVAWWVDHRAIGVQRDEAQAMVKQLQRKPTAYSPNELIMAIITENPGLAYPQNTRELLTRWTILETLRNRAAAAREMVKQIEAAYQKGTVSADQVSSAKEQQAAAVQALQAEVLKIGG